MSAYDRQHGAHVSIYTDMAPSRERTLMGSKVPLPPASPSTAEWLLQTGCFHWPIVCRWRTGVVCTAKSNVLQDRCLAVLEQSVEVALAALWIVAKDVKLVRCKAVADRPQLNLYFERSVAFGLRWRWNQRRAHRERDSHILRGAHQANEGGGVRGRSRTNETERTPKTEDRRSKHET